MLFYGDECDSTNDRYLDNCASTFGIAVEKELYQKIHADDEALTELEAEVERLEAQLAARRAARYAYAYAA